MPILAQLRNGFWTMFGGIRTMRSIGALTAVPFQIALQTRPHNVLPQFWRLRLRHPKFARATYWQPFNFKPHYTGLFAQ